jgi:hypothetical protein
MNESLCIEIRQATAAFALSLLLGTAVAAERAYVVTPDGRRIPLQEKAMPEPAPVLRKPYEHTVFRPRLLPAQVDLTPYQSPVTDQGGRDTCGTFATAAALEAAYVRGYGITPDVSEQFLNHWGQIMAGAGGATTLPATESVAGMIGGGGMLRPLGALRKGLGVPSESDLPYHVGTAYQDFDVGDLPAINDWWTAHPQREMDDFNLADAPANYVYAPPSQVTDTVMPQGALENARYRVTGVTYLTGGEVTDVNHYRAILAAHHEIVIEMNCCDGNPGWQSTAPWLLPAGSNGGGAGHVMLVVGYDDSSQMFRVKNSWSTGWANNGYVWLSYDFVRQGVVRGAAYLDGVVSPQAQFDVWTNRALWIGRWNLLLAGAHGILDIYALPDPASTPPNDRLGTLFMDDGRTARVNGTFDGNRAHLFVDWSQPDQPPASLSGTQITLYLFSWEHRSLAGLATTPSGALQPVAARKGPSPVSGRAQPGAIRLATLLGAWRMDHDGWQGTLEITSVVQRGSTFRGQYTPNSGGRPLPVTGTYGPVPGRFEMTIGFPTPQRFEGLLHLSAPGVMTGTTQWSGLTFGFYGMRR